MGGRRGEVDDQNNACQRLDQNFIAICSLRNLDAEGILTVFILAAVFVSSRVFRLI